MSELLTVIGEIIEFLPEWERRWDYNWPREQRIHERARDLEGQLRRLLKEEESE